MKGWWVMDDTAFKHQRERERERERECERERERKREREKAFSRSRLSVRWSSHCFRPRLLQRADPLGARLSAWERVKQDS